jgi:hypothetical protein
MPNNINDPYNIDQLDPNWYNYPNPYYPYSQGQPDVMANPEYNQVQGSGSIQGGPYGTAPLGQPNLGDYQAAFRGAIPNNNFPTSSTSSNPAPSFNYEGARDAWMSGKYGTGEEAARQWAKEYGITYNGGDTINLPNGGGYIDILGNFRNNRGMTNTWTPAGGNGPNPGSTPGGGGGAGGLGGGGGSGFLGPMDPKLQQLYDELLSRATQGLKIDRNDPIIRDQADAYSANLERSKRNDLADLAERSGPLANLRGETRLANERMGQAAGAFEAQLMGRELTARRDEIAQALSSMQGLLTTEQQLALQRELGLLNNAIQQQQLNNQLSMFNNQLGFNYWDAQNKWDLANSQT